MTGPAVPATPLRPALRLVPAPQPGIPYDDERALEDQRPDDRAWRASRGPGAAAVAGTQGTLALAFPLNTGVPAVPAPPARLRAVGRGLTGSAAGTGAAAVAGGRPPVKHWAAMMVQAIVEAEVGDRPLTQLTRWTTPAVYDLIDARRAGSGRRSAGTRRGTARAVVTSVHVCEVADDVLEVCATVRRSGRARAVALRLEGCADAWRCTALSIG